MTTLNISSFIWGIADDVLRDVVTGKLDVCEAAAQLPDGFDPEGRDGLLIGNVDDRSNRRKERDE